MVFSSIAFLYIFLPAVLILHFIAPKKAKNAVLLIASLVFYYIGEQRLTLIMIASAVVDFFCSLGIERLRERKKLTRIFLGASLLFNLSLLGYFKYADLFIRSFNLLTGAAVPLLRVALPIGISFYTFQTMSYTIDVYRGNVKAERNFLNFAAYVTIFPQLIAGPIVRYESIATELKERDVSVSDFAEGIKRFCFGIGKKVLLANQLAELISLQGDASSKTLLFSWMCGIAVPLQIYFDFSGYSDMAIGLGRMLGFHFPENFDYPFISKSATEFWRRWHMTLGSWFRDYVYFPLGGSRVGTGRHIVNLLIVWFATGLWHGAEYNFVIWGLFYGVLIICEKHVYGKFLEKSRILSRIYFAIVTVVGFEIFDASSFKSIGIRIGELFGIGTESFANGFSLYYAKSYIVVILLAFALAMPWLKNLVARAKQKSPKLETAIVASECVLSLVLLVVSTAYLVDGSYNPFLYFRF